MNNLWLITIIISTVSGTLTRTIKHVLDFIIKLLFSSYNVNSHSNERLIDSLTEIITQNLVSWQTQTHALYADPGNNQSKFEGQKCELADGLYFFRYQGCLFWVYIKISGSWWHRSHDITVMTFRWNQDVIDHLFESSNNETDSCLSIYYFRANRSVSMNKCGTIRKKSLNSVILPAAIKAKLISDLNNFTNPETKQIYRERGFAYKRGYLFAGRPGCGKSSTILAIANYLKRHIHQIPLNSSGLDDDTFLVGLRSIPKNSIVIFEDLDVAFPKRQSKDKKKMKKAKNDDDEEDEDEDEDDEEDEEEIIKKRSRITMQCFINALDGLNSPDNGLIMIFTTNHPEKLDPAILRSGRMDMKLDFNLLDSEGVQKMFRLFYPQSLIQAKRISEVLIERYPAGIIPCEFNEFLIRNLKTPEDKIIDHLDEFAQVI